MAISRCGPEYKEQIKYQAQSSWDGIRYCSVDLPHQGLKREAGVRFEMKMSAVLLPVVSAQSQLYSSYSSSI